MLRANERLYLQYQPDLEGVRLLTTLQAAAYDSNPQARLIQPDRLHLTVLHFGILADVYRELSEQVLSLTWDQYEKGIKQFLAQSQRALPEKTEVIPDRLELFGSRSTVLALRTTVKDEVTRAHAHALGALKEFFLFCGIEHPVPFMQGSTNFRFALQLEPHISLLKAARQKPDMNTPLSVGPITMVLLPVYYT